MSLSLQKTQISRDFSQLRHTGRLKKWE